MSVAGLVSRFIRGITSNEVLWQHEVENFERLFPEIYREHGLSKSSDYRDKYYKLYPKVYELQSRSYKYLLEHKITDGDNRPLDVYDELQNQNDAFERATVVRRKALLTRWNSLIALRQIYEKESVSIKGITELPDKILGLLTRFSELRRLEFEFCAFEHLPDSIGRLAQLTSLVVKNTCLKSLPTSIGALTGLNSMDLSDNNLSTLPKTITCLHQLRFLALKGNKFIALPKNKSLMSFLENLGYTSDTIIQEQLEVSRDQDPSTWPSYWSMRLSNEEQRIISS